MKIIIIFLLVLSGIFLSCNHPIQPTILNTRPNYKQGAGIEYVKNQLPINTLINIPIHTLQEVCGCLDALMEASRESKKLRCLEDIIGHNREDYRFRGRSLSNQYAEQFNKSAEHHNKFLGYISQLCDSDSSLNSQIKGPLALAVFSKSPEVVLECITCLENKGVKIDINANDLFGMPVLHYAIASGDANMVKVLLEHAPRIHIDGKDKVFDFRVLLGQAICVGTTDIVKLLIEKDADPNWSYNGLKADEHGNGFRLAVIYDRKDMARHFIKKKLILLNQPDEYRRTSVMDV